MAKISELVVNITGDNTGLKKTLSDSVKQTDSAFSKVGKAVAFAGTSLGIFGGILKGIDFNKAAEQAQVSFSTMLGSTEAATAALKELKDFANTTPMEFADVRDSTQTLLQFGMGANEAISTVKMLGDVSGGNAEKMKLLSTAMGQISSAGRMQGQDLMQLINSGFNPLLVISEKTGKSMEELRDDMAEGSISADMVKDAFKTATSEGGQFFGMLEKQGKTLVGVQSTLEDSLGTFLGKMTESFTEPLKGLMTLATNVLGFLTGLPGPVLAAVGAFSALGAGILAITTVAPMMGIALSSAFGPIAIAAAGAIAVITGIGLAISDNIKKQDEWNKIQTGKSDKTKEEKIKVIDEHVAALKKEAQTYKDSQAAMLKGYSEEDQARIKTQRSYQTLAKELSSVESETRVIIGLKNTMVDALAKEAKAAKAASDAQAKSAQDAAKASAKAEAEAARIIAEREEATKQRIANEKAMEDRALAVRLAQEKARLDELKKQGAERVAVSIAANAAIEAGATAWRDRVKAAEEADFRYRIKLADEEYQAKKALKEKEKAESDARRAGDLGNIKAGINQAIGEISKSAPELGAIFSAIAPLVTKSIEGIKITATDVAASITGVLAGAFNGIASLVTAAMEKANASAIKGYEKTQKIFESLKNKELKTELDLIAKVEAAQNKAREKAFQAEMKAFEASIKAKQKAIETTLKANVAAIDAETKKKLEAAGIDVRTDMEVAQAKLDNAIVMGDAALAEEARKEMAKLQIMAEAEAQKIAAEEAAEAARLKLESDADAERIKRQEAYDAERLFRQSAYDAEVAAKKKRTDDAIAKSQKDLENKKLKIAYESEKARFDMQIGMAIAGAAAAIVQGFAQLGPIGGAIAAVGVGIATGIQLGIMAANAPVLQQLALGTNFANGGATLVGEQGPEMVYMPKGAQVKTASQTKEMKNSGGATINIYSPTAVTPSEASVIMRQTMRQMAFEGVL